MNYELRAFFRFVRHCLVSRLSNEVSSHPQCTVISQNFDKNHEKTAVQKQAQSAGIELKTELQKSETVKYFQYNLFI